MEKLISSLFGKHYVSTNLPIKITPKKIRMRDKEKIKTRERLKTLLDAVQDTCSVTKLEICENFYSTDYDIVIKVMVVIAKNEIEASFASIAKCVNRDYNKVHRMYQSGFTRQEQKCYGMVLAKYNYLKQLCEG